MLKGIDISSYQSDMDIRRLQGVDFIVIKATEGTGYVNSVCDTHYQEAKAAGVLRGVYHFLANKVNSAQAEAKFFVDNIQGYLGDAILVVDNENSPYNDQNNVPYLLAWCEEVEALTGVKPLVYMNASCVNSNDWSSVINNGNALWVAAYQAAAPDVNWPNSDQAMWQFTSQAHVVGYSGSVDEDDFWGDKTGWANYATAHKAAPQPTPEPPAPQPTPPTSEPSTPVTPDPVQPEPTPPVSQNPQPVPSSPVSPVTKPIITVKLSWWKRLLKLLFGITV